MRSAAVYLSIYLSACLLLHTHALHPSPLDHPPTYLPTYHAAAVAHTTRWMAASVLLSASIHCIWRTTASTWRVMATHTSSPSPLCCSTPACSVHPTSRRRHKPSRPPVLLLPPAMITTAAVATTAEAAAATTA